MAINAPVSGEQVRQIYKQYLGREPEVQELAHHASSKTGLEHLTSWAQQQGGAPGASSQNPISNFNTSLMGLLKQYQGLSSADLIKRQNAILKGMYSKQSAVTPEDLRTLSPTQQAAIRSGQTEAMRPELEATKGLMLDREEARSRFLESFSIARQISTDIETLREKQADKAMEGMKMLAYSGQPLDQQDLDDVASLTGYDSGALFGYYQELVRQSENQKTLDALELKIKQKSYAAGAGTPPGVYGTYKSRLETVVDEVYSGRYGTEGSREKALAILQNEFPDQDVSKDIYTRIPDGYEAQIGSGEPPSKITTSWDNLTPTVKQEIMAWMATQEGYEPSYNSRVKTDPDFADFIIGKYYSGE